VLLQSHLTDSYRFVTASLDTRSATVQREAKTLYTRSTALQNHRVRCHNSSGAFCNHGAPVLWLPASTCGTLNVLQRAPLLAPRGQPA
jgi:hypothetical protein